MEKPRGQKRQHRRKKRKNHPILTSILILLPVALVLGLLLGACIYMSRTGADFFTALRQTVHLGGQYIANTVGPTGASVPVNPYRADDFYRRGDFIQCSTSDVSRTGIDVSSHQEEIDWNAVAEAGVEYAIVRVGYRGYSEGDVFTDSMAIANLQGALAAGLDVGVYFYSQAITEQEAQEEAWYLLDTIDGFDIRYPVVYDWEGPPTDTARTAAVTGEEATRFAQAFCSAVEQAGYTAGVYFNQSYGYDRFDLRALRDYEFWLAEYADTQSFAYAVQLWQYDNAALVSGISTPVDVNLCYRDYTAEKG